MSEVMERKEEQAEEAALTEQTPLVQPDAPETAPEKPAKKKMSRKTRRKLIRWTVTLLLLAALGFGLYRYFAGKKSGGEEQILTDTVQYGAITAKVEGSGMTRAKDNAPITISTPGTMLEVLVEEGQKVEAGDRLFVVDSPAAQAAVDKARSAVEGYQKQLSALQKDIAGLNLAPTYPGKLMETVKLNPGDEISKGTTVAKINDDTRLRLTQYYSYAYADSLYEGQEVQVSIPSLMVSLPGKVEKVNMVSRITPEGSKLFSADILVDNDGALTADMTASATVTVDGESVYPYEPGQLQYYRTGELKSTVSGRVISSRLVDFLQVKPGEVLVKIDGEDSEAEIFALQQSLDGAQEELDKALKNLANCSATAPIAGTVIGLTTKAGEEISTQGPICTISDTSVLNVTADVDERNISSVKVGTAVELDQWDNLATGTVSSVSLSSTVSNGAARYPITIAVENPDGKLQVNSYINYSIVASQNDNCLILPVQCVHTVSDAQGEPISVVYVGGEKPENALEGIESGEQIPEGYWPVKVETGIQDSINVEIKSGVEEGAEVFTQIQTSF